GLIVGTASGNHQLTITGGSSVTGGAGGNGGENIAATPPTWGGGGGGGGDGVLLLGQDAAVVIDATGLVAGGAGGAGGYGTFAKGDDGDSGAGIRAMGIGLNVDNHGTIRGGSGTGGGAAGVGIITQGAANITNYGMLSGGTDTNGRASSVLFNGTNNTLNLQSGSTVLGAVEVGSGASATIDPDTTVTIDGARLDGGGAQLLLDLASASLDMGSSITGTGDVSASGTGALTLHGVNLMGSLDLANSGGVVTSGGVIGTSGLQHYAGPVQIGADTTFSSTSNSITFDRSIDGSHALEVDAVTGNVNFGGALGGLQALSSVVVHSNTLSIGGVNAGSLYLDVATSITQSGAFSITGASIFQTDGDLTLTNASNAFGGALQIQSANVDVTASGDLNVSSLSAAPLGDITLTSGGVLTLPTTGLSTGGTIILKGAFVPGELSARSIDLDATGGLIFDDNVIATEDLALHAIGNISQTAGVIVANMISADAGSNDVTLSQAGNAINTVEDISARALSIANSTALTFAGTVHVDTLDLNVGVGASITGSVTADTVANLSTGTTLTVGAGGTAGTLQADVVDDGVLAFNRSDAVSFAGALSGSGTLVQRGSGSLVFDGDGSAFQGQTRVEAGEFVVGSVSGSGANLAGDITVADGATLGGHGSVGTTTVLSGGTLAPGASIGTLTVNGDLVMAQGTKLDFEFGAPGVGDSVSVNGNLSLNGVELDVTDTGTMGPGVYRIFDYSGTLSETNGGITFGSIPGGSQFQLQTLLGQKQINLLNVGGATLNFWNANGLASGSQRGGGDGTWSTTSPVWTDENGSITGAMSPQPGFAIFGGEAGLVSVDGIDGNVVASGMQFTSDGYHLVGDALTLVADAGHPAPVEIRVGDGGAGSENWIATIDNEVAGTDGLRKTGAGTLVLGGTNTYSGDTEIDAGVLSASADANLGDYNGALTFNGGTLQVTGTTFDATARAVTLGAAGGTIDIVDAGNQFRIGARIEGDGGLTKAGAGALRLGAASSYAGATVVEAGTLALDGDGSVAASSSLSLNGGSFDIAGIAADATGVNTLSGAGGSIALGGKTLVVSQAADAVYAGTISGGGVFVKEGNGSLTMTGDSNDGAGGSVTVEGGVLALAGTGSLASRSLVVDGGIFDIAALAAGGTTVQGLSGTGGVLSLGDKTLTTDQAVDATFAGVLSGTGAFVKEGDAELTLTGDSSAFAGLVSIMGGGLSTQAQLLSGDVDIAAAGTLTFDQTSNAAYAGAFSGAGAFIKQGSAILAYDGDGSGFTGTTTVAEGSLIVGSDRAHGDAVLGGAVDVLTGALLGGHGTLGSVTLGSGATIAPGNSIGTINVAGDITFAAGSTYEVEVDPAGTDSDLIHATGQATLNGASVAHIGLGGTYKPSSLYTILTADGGLTGTFGDVTSDFAFLNPALSYDADSVNLRLVRNDVDFCMAGMTANECATGTGAESVGSGNAIYDAIAGLSASQAGNAFDQLSGEVHASVKSVLIDDSHFVRDAATDRIRSAFAAVGSEITPVLAYGEDGNRLAAADTPGTAAWGRAFGAWTDLDGDGNAAALSASTGGFLTGIDAGLGDNWRAGVMGGYSHTSFDVGGRASSGDSTNWHLGLYGGGQWGALGVRAGAAYTWHDIETARSVAFPGFADSLSGDYSAGTAQVFGEVAYDIKAGAIGLEPFANLAYVNLHTDGFTEKGGAAALTSASSDTDVTFTTLGLRASTSLTLGTVEATARGMLGWLHAYGDTAPLSSFGFAGSDAFSIAGIPIAKDAAFVEAGLDLNLSPNTTLGIAYQGQFAGGANQNGFNATFKVQF
ncbi:autotransporter outer membrane beta-barrel domain-containing protein, partial [Mesorhizobium sp. B2-2-2]